MLVNCPGLKLLINSALKLTYVFLWQNYYEKEMNLYYAVSNTRGNKTTNRHFAVVLKLAVCISLSELLLYSGSEQEYESALYYCTAANSMYLALWITIA